MLAAGLAVTIPSSISVATVMTESLSYVATAWALYAIMLALERPTVLRQFGVLAATAVAFLTRPQFGILYVTWVGALGAFWMIAPWARPRAGRRPAFLADGAAGRPRILAFAARLASGASASDSLGAYWVLWRGYDPLQVGKWFVYHLGDFAVYLAIVPVAVAPIVLVALTRAGRAGSRPAAAFVALFAAANVSGLLVVAAFASSPWGFDRLHDRYGFYLLPLWLIGLVVWLDSGLPRPLVATAIGVVAALALPLILPFGQLANEAGIDTVPGALWERVEAELAGPGRRRAASPSASSSSGSSRQRSSCRGGSPGSPCPWPWPPPSPPCRTSRGSGWSGRRRTSSSRAASNAPGSTIGSRRTPR